MFLPLLLGRLLLAAHPLLQVQRECMFTFFFEKGD
jgi:hypothetical protein